MKARPTADNFRVSRTEQGLKPHHRDAEAAGTVTAGIESMIARMLAGYVAIFWISELDGMVHQLRLSPAWWDFVLLPALAVSIGGLVWNAATRRPIAAFAGGHALVILGAVFVEIFVGTTPPDAVPWLWPMTGVAVVCATAAWGLSWAALYGAALSTVWIVLRLLPEGGAKAVPFAVSDGLFILVGGIGVGSIAAGMISGQAARPTLWRIRSRAARRPRPSRRHGPTNATASIESSTTRC